LARSDTGPSLYVHVPFCTDKCIYCDFYSVPRGSVAEGVQAAVVDQTIAQARFLLEAAGNPRVQTIFFGGGTPSALPPGLLEKLLGSFSDLRPVEWTVEANPETIDETFLACCRDSGVTRLSVGIQTLQPRLLSLLRRRASQGQCLAAVDLLQRRWRGELSLDFIAGIPGQTVHEVENDLALVDRSWPGHVSLYQLTTEPGTRLVALIASGEIEMNPAEKDEELWFAGKAGLEGLGYAQYEVSNFALPGRECLHNIRYWKIEPYIGAGPAAVSTVAASIARKAFGLLPERSEAAAVRLSCPKSMQGFLQGAASRWGIEIEMISPRDFLLETLMMGLRPSSGINMAAFARRFGKSLAELLPGLWEGWVRKGWAEPLMTTSLDGAMRLSPIGMMLLDRLLGEAAGRISTESLSDLTVTWP
jgi:oxygen-independent coproporphyrinogen-3 oxidase